MEIHVLESKAIQHLSLIIMAAVDRLMKAPDGSDGTLGSFRHSTLELVQQCGEHCAAITVAARAAGQCPSPEAIRFRWACLRAAVQTVYTFTASELLKEVETGTCRLSMSTEFDPVDLFQKIGLTGR